MRNKSRHRGTKSWEFHQLKHLQCWSELGIMCCNSVHQISIPTELLRFRLPMRSFPTNRELCHQVAAPSRTKICLACRPWWWLNVTNLMKIKRKKKCFHWILAKQMRNDVMSSQICRVTSSSSICCWNFTTVQNETLKLHQTNFKPKKICVELESTVGSTNFFTWHHLFL